MKILYCIHSLFNPGGMERVVLNKAAWLTTHGYEVVVVTTDQKERPLFYEFPAEVRIIDLGINYSDDKGKNVIVQTLSYLKKRKFHKWKLTQILLEERADIVDTLYPGESSFIPSIKDGSKKIIELHQNKYFHRQYANTGLKGLADRIREWMDVSMVQKFDRFIVLTEEDAALWGKMNNIQVIPNASTLKVEKYSDCSSKRVIAVGRLDYQKGFDRLINAWEIAMNSMAILQSRCSQMTETQECNGGWKLSIFGQGEWREMLQEMISKKGLEGSVSIETPTKDIVSEYLKSSLLVMSSHYEGLSMVMLEAMSCGLPVVSFDCKCGPKDLIQDGENGLLVDDGDINGLANSMLRLMLDDELRMNMGHAAQSVADKYSEESIMKLWDELFRSLTATENA